MTKRRVSRILLTVSSLLGASVAAAGAASAYGPPPRTGPCPDRVVMLDAPATIYLAHGTKPRKWYGQNAWLYLETNGVPGLQRQDQHCDDPGSSHDTVLFSTRILCTCDYPFGDYFPLNQVDDVAHWVWWQLLPVLLLLPPLPV
jgi:hypothetical protein